MRTPPNNPNSYLGGVTHRSRATNSYKLVLMNVNFQNSINSSVCLEKQIVSYG